MAFPVHVEDDAGAGVREGHPASYCGLAGQEVIGNSLLARLSVSIWKHSTYELVKGGETYWLILDGLEQIILGIDGGFRALGDIWRF